MLKDLPKSLIEAAKALKVDVKSNSHSSNLRKREKEIAASHDANVKEEVEQLDEKEVVFTGSPKHTSKKADEYKKLGYKVKSMKKHTSGSFGDNSEKHTYKMVREEENIDEALKGNQHKIDADKDGKIEKSDFAALRKKKMKEGYVSDAQRKAVWAARNDKKEANEEVQFSDEELARIQEIINGTTDK